MVTEALAIAFVIMPLKSMTIVANANNNTAPMEAIFDGDLEVVKSVIEEWVLTPGRSELLHHSWRLQLMATSRW